MSDDPFYDYKLVIRDAGLKLFAEKGVEAVSVAQICRDAEVANGTFYNFYRNKSELVAEFLTEAYEGLAAKLRDADGEASNAEEQHRRDVTIIVDFTAENSDLIRIALRDEGAKRLTEQNVTEMFIHQRAAGLKRGMATGFYRAGIDPEMAARTETGLMNEILSWWLSDQSKIDRELLIDSLVAIRLRITNGEVS
ncbi:TetR/AcrR family transcriptional regulator [Parvularcula maris]|uniref:TetR/AcrR family transcriptional regulator n=1 Tax=Parvularcula maris TaxID=2965077 RepID=A0A9X2LA16_9PROT|nr:TetR/AcrR family transcriptional regulator [Parvularcula maris]MCQ8185871.1 TetR/AcrR family transcriptional regulator [Parvularcula maris]